MTKRFWKRLAFSASAAAIMSPAAAIAQESVYQFNIPAQDLGAALRSFGQQSGQQLGFDASITHGKQSNALTGGYSADEGLRRLLEGTGLNFERSPAGVLVVQDPNSPTRLGDASGAAPSDDGTGTPEMLVVTGTRTLNADIRRSEDASQPYVVLNRDEIRRSGATDAEDLIRRSLGQVSNTETLSQSPGTLGTGSTIFLRGLDFDETLILVDGRRVAAANFGGEFLQPDIRGIPIDAIERVEVLASSASGIYGGGATGGAINIILRRDYHGLDLRYTHSGAFAGDGNTDRIDLSGGRTFNDGRTNVMFAYSRSEDAGVLLGDRDYVERYRAHILDTNPATLYSGFLPPAGTTTNIRSATGVNLTLKPAFGGGAIGSNLTYVPIGYAGPGSDNGAGLIANAGQFNLAVPDTTQVAAGGLSPLTPENLLQSMDFTVRHDLTPHIQAFFEASAAQNLAHWNAGGGTGRFTLSAADPANPFNQSIVVRAPTYGAVQTAESETDNYRALVGLTFDLPGEWRGGFDYSWNRSTLESRVPITVFNSGATPAVRAGTINVFSDFRGVSDFSPYLRGPTISGPGETTANLAALRLSGPIGLHLPGGAPVLSLTLEHRQEDLAPTTIGDTTYFSRSQTTSSAFAELLLPAISPENHVWGVDLLEFQLAGRSDWYDVTSSNNTEFGPTTEVDVDHSFTAFSPTIAVRYRPVPQLMLRASYAEGFLPPNMGQLSPNPSYSDDGGFYGLTDPLRGNEAIGAYEVFNGGNPDLDPETSRSLSIGAVAEPFGPDGLRVSLDWTRIEKLGNIENAFQVYSPETFDFVNTYAPGRIIRSTDPLTFGSFGVGPIIAIDESLGNVATSLSESFDLTIDQRWSTSIGDFQVQFRGTHLVSLRSQVSPIAPVIEYVDQAPRDRASLSLVWDRDGMQAAWVTRYNGAYTVADFYAADQGGKVPSQTASDLYFRYAFGQIHPSLLTGTTLELGVKNVFDELPPVDTSQVAGGGYSHIGDGRGRSGYVSLRRTF
jgi:iron complex outermembrane receptor protein